ncbi:DNA -binding domain-containing protein [Mesorhizobium sp. ORM6]
MNRSTGTDGSQSSTLRDEVPWSESLTSYDRQHFKIYLRILDACADNASLEEMADLILGIDPALEPVRARQAVRSHIDRANWIVTTGYKELFAG